MGYSIVRITGSEQVGSRAEGGREQGVASKILSQGHLRGRAEEHARGSLFASRTPGYSCRLDSGLFNLFCSLPMLLLQGLPATSLTEWDTKLRSELGLTVTTCYD